MSEDVSPKVRALLETAKFSVGDDGIHITPSGGFVTLRVFRDPVNGRVKCTCQEFQEHLGNPEFRCDHIHAVKAYLSAQEAGEPDRQPTAQKPPPEQVEKPESISEPDDDEIEWNPGELDVMIGEINHEFVNNPKFLAAVGRLAAKLPEGAIKRLPWDKKYRYIKGDTAIVLANLRATEFATKILSTWEVRRFTADHGETVVWACHMRVTVEGVSREAIGSCVEEGPDEFYVPTKPRDDSDDAVSEWRKKVRAYKANIGRAVDTAIKGAETDAFKRALRYFMLALELYFANAGDREGGGGGRGNYGGGGGRSTYTKREEQVGLPEGQIIYLTKLATAAGMELTAAALQICGKTLAQLTPTEGNNLAAKLREAAK